MAEAGEMVMSKKRCGFSVKGEYPETFSLYRGRAPKLSDVFVRNRNRIVLVFDETGSIGPLGSGEYDLRKDFVVVMSFVEDAVSMSHVRKKFPKSSGEYKYKDATLKDAPPIFDELAKQDFGFLERHRSRRNQSFQTVKGAWDFYIESISVMIDEVAPDAPFDVLIDKPPTTASKELIKLCKDKIEGGMKIEWFDVADSQSQYLLQVHDFVTGAVGDNINGIGKKAPLFGKIESKRVK